MHSEICNILPPYQKINNDGKICTHLSFFTSLYIAGLYLLRLNNYFLNYHVETC